MQKGDWVWIGKADLSKYSRYQYDSYYADESFQERYGRVDQVMVENVAVYVTPSLVVTFPKHQLREV